MHFVGVYKSRIARCCCANPIVTPWDWTTTDLDVTAATPFTDPGANEFLREQLRLAQVVLHEPLSNAGLV